LGFCYFLDSFMAFGCVGLDCDSLDVYLLSSWNYRCVATEGLAHELILKHRQLLVKNHLEELGKITSS
jgi:hypothetical protein